MPQATDELGHFDVLIVGFGPTGAVLACQLGQCGVSVLVIESTDTLYDWPRAVHLDAEVMLILRSLNIPRAQLDACTFPMTHLTFRDDNQDELLRFQTRLSDLSHDLYSDYLFHQPSLERAIRSQVDQYPSVKVIHGARVVSVIHDTHAVLVSTECGLSATATFVVGSDGARSVTRSCMEVPLLSFPSIDVKQSDQWLVLDGFMNAQDKHRAGIKELGVTQICNPEQPMTIVSLADDMIRVELMLREEPYVASTGSWSDVWSQIDELCHHLIFIIWHLIAPLIASKWSMAGDTQQEKNKSSYSPSQSDLQSNTKLAYSLLPSWFPSSSLRITRASRYRTRGLLAQSCSSEDQRLFLAGDSMHQTPPFIGQGGCLGMRDSANLSWKLAFALRHQAGDRRWDPLTNALLSTYETERKEEAHELIGRSLKLGQLICWPQGLTCSLNHWFMKNMLNHIPALKRRFAASPTPQCSFSLIKQSIRWTDIDSFLPTRDRMLVAGLGMDPFQHVDHHPMMSKDDCYFVRLERASMRDWLCERGLPLHIDIIVFRPDGFVFAMYSSTETRWIGQSAHVHYTQSPFPIMHHLYQTLEQLAGACA